MKKWIIVGAIAGAVVLLVAWLSISYVVASANRARYKRQTQELVVATFDALKKTKSGGPKTSLRAFKQLKSDSELAAEELEDRPAPSGAEELKATATQLIDLANEIADRGVLFFTYIVKVNGVIERWSDDITGANKSGEPIDKLKGFESATGKAADNLKKLKPPSHLVNFHLKLNDLLDDMSGKLGEMISAANAKDAAKLQALTEEWNKMAERFEGLAQTIGDDVADDIMTRADRVKMDRLAQKIDRF